MCWNYDAWDRRVTNPEVSAADANLRFISEGRWRGVNTGAVDELISSPARRGRRVLRFSRSIEALRVQSMAMSDQDYCAAVSERVWCWERPGTDIRSQRVMPRWLHEVSVPEPVAQIIATDTAFCARTTSEHVYCWGVGTWHVLQTPHCRSSRRALLIRGLPQVRELVTRRELVCGITADRAVWCWGSLACNLPTAPRYCLAENSVPTRDTRLCEAQQLAIGCWEKCAIQPDGSMRCAFGAPEDNPLDGGRGTAPPPIHVRLTD